MGTLADDVKAVSTFVDGGAADLKTHNFVSGALNEKRQSASKASAENLAFIADDAGNPGPEGDSEQKVSFRMNTTGNIFYSTSSEKITEETKNLFDTVAVLFAAMTRAAALKGKSLFDYDVWSKMIANSGFFAQVQDFSCDLEIKSHSISIDTQIVQELLPGIKDGTQTMAIAKSVLSALNMQMSKDTSNESTKVAHLLFICEELFGAPSVTVRLFYATKQTHTEITKTRCSQTTNVDIHQTQQADTFLFVDPQKIAAQIGGLSTDQQAYNDFIDKIAANIEPPK